MTQPTRLHSRAMLKAIGCTALGWSALLLGHPALAQNAALNNGIGAGTGILPSTGFGGALPNLQDFIDTPLTKGGTQAFTFQPQIGVQAGYTDNVGGQGGSLGGGTAGQKAQGSFEGRLLPSIALVGGVRRVTVNLTYDPVLYYYPQVNSQSRVDQNLNGDALIELYDQTAFLDLKAFASQTPVVNAYGSATSSAISREALERLYNVSANPYLIHQFGDIGTGKLSYTIADSVIQNSSQTGYGGVTSGGQNSRSLSQTEDANFSTGDAFGRFNHTVDLSGQQSSGSGALASSYRYEATYAPTYAINRFIAINAKIGYEDVHYSAVYTGGVETSRAYNLNSPLGTLGFTLTPNDDSSLALSYGYVDGGTSVKLDATYKPTARIALFATSSSGVTTNLQQLNSFAGTARTTLAGVTIDPRTGAPIQYSNGSNNNASAVYRLTQSSLTGVLSLNRDTLTAGLSADQRESPGGGSAGSASNPSTNGSDIIGNLGWQHQLSETFTSSLTGSYGITQSKGQGTTPFVVANASLSKTFTEQLSGTVNYSLYKRSSSAANPGVTVNEILLGLLQKF